MDLSVLMIVLSLIIICSFFYNYLLEKFQVSSVILLIITGLLLKLIAYHAGLNLRISPDFLALFGTLGLIAIVLEASFDLKIAKHNSKIVINALAMSILIMFFTIAAIAAIFVWYFKQDWLVGCLYATPLSILSSAIVIPSVAHLSNSKKEYLIFESIFSDVIGILIFNFLLISEFKSLIYLWQFLLSLILMIVISFVVSIILALVINHSNRPNRHVFILAVLILIYSLAKLGHLSALLLILIFGMTLNSIQVILKQSRFANLFDFSAFKEELEDMQGLTAEFAFIVRTIFFVLFGYMINLHLLVSINVILIGMVVLGLIYLLRFLNLKIILGSNKLIEVLTAPRGLITVLLFYQIPDKFNINDFNSGVIFFVVVLSSLIMSIGLIYYGRNEHGI